MPGRGFIICWVFYYFFRNFLARVEFERRSGLKFCFLFFGLSHPVLAKLLPGISFINFWAFLQFFSEFSCPGRVWTEFGTKIFFSLFRFISSRFGQNYCREEVLQFLKFFYYFFSKFSFPGRVWTEFRTKILFSLFRSTSSRFC